MNKEKTFKEKAVGFYNAHKEAIILGVVSLTTVVLGIVLVDKLNAIKKADEVAMVSIPVMANLKCSDEYIMDVGKLTFIEDYTLDGIRNMECILNDVTLEQAGELGQNLITNFGFKNTDIISASMIVIGNEAFDNTDIQ